MAKKKDADFRKPKLRLGKALPKGRNVTDTSFKTRKIVTHDQLTKVPGEVSLKDLLICLGCNNANKKVETLHKLQKVVEKKDTLSWFFPDILKKVGSTLLEYNSVVREAAIDVMHTCLSRLSHLQITCFLGQLTGYLNGMMTHTSINIRTDSLKFLDRIMLTHPKVICHSTSVLNNLLNLISSMVIEKSVARGRKRKLDERVSSNMTSQEWRIQVIGRIYSFLENALREETRFKDTFEDEREVYWDVEKPLYLPLYLHGGATPLSLESLNSRSDSKITDSEEFMEFIGDLVPLMSEVIKGEISSKRSSSDKTLQPTAVTHLNFVVKILCCLCEWLNNKSILKVTENQVFTKQLSDIICLQLLKGFPFTQNTSVRQAVKQSLQLNLGISYLYSLLILNSDSNSSEMKNIISYLKDACLVSIEVSYEYITLMLKITKLFITSNNVNETWKNAILLGLFGKIQDHRPSSCAQLVDRFFMDVSLNYDFKYLLKSESMQTWFKITLQDIMTNSGNVTKRSLKYTRQICARRYPYFMELLNKIQPADFLKLLKYDDEEFQLTITHLLCAMDEPCDIFYDLTDLLSDPSFSLKTAIRIINLLHARFSGENARGKEKLLFLQFLLNLGCDTPVILDTSWKSSLKCSHMLSTVLQACSFNLIPSQKWERHSKIIKACFDCVPTYMQIGTLGESAISFLNSIMSENKKLPIHSAIALLKLRRPAYEVYPDEHLVADYNELIFSSLMYLSVLHIDCKKEDLDLYAIPDLQKSLHLQRGDVSEIINIINGNVYNFGENELYHALRMTLYLIHENLLRMDNRREYYGVLEKINMSCERSKLLHPLWINICKFFLFM